LQIAFSKNFVYSSSEIPNRIGGGLSSLGLIKKALLAVKLGVNNRAVT
jgi:hypothetical protein